MIPPDKGGTWNRRGQHVDFTLPPLNDAAVVFESLVQSGYWVPMGANQDRDRLASSRKPKITRPNWC